MRKRFDSHKCLDVKPWVIAAINNESRYPSDQLWKKEPTAEYVHKERLGRIKFLRKHGVTNPQAQTVVDRLETCEPTQRCSSGACPECGRLLQRRLKYALEAVGIGVALGGIDFSFNEDRDEKYRPFWSPHFYLITSTHNNG